MADNVQLSAAIGVGAVAGADEIASVVYLGVLLQIFQLVRKVRNNSNRLLSRYV